MTNDYKEKLKTFIAEIPAYPAQIESGEAKTSLSYPELTEKIKDKNYTLPTKKLFLKYTGTEHLDLVKNWLGGGIKTTCNEFIGKCGYTMGAKHFLGQFELAELLRKIGKGHAWVPADGKSRPGYGDVFRMVELHMGISLDFEDGDWLTVESGQGGPRLGFDALKRKRRKFDPALMLGWCDMKLYLDPRPPVPDWLTGMWVIYCGDKTYNYLINQYHEVLYYPWMPIGSPQNATPTDTGTVAFNGSADFFNITWSKEGGVEKFKYDRFESFPGIMEKIGGTGSRGEILKGVRL